MYVSMTTKLTRKIPMLKKLKSIKTTEVFRQRAVGRGGKKHQTG